MLVLPTASFKQVWCFPDKWSHGYKMYQTEDLLDWKQHSLKFFLKHSLPSSLDSTREVYFYSLSVKQMRKRSLGRQKVTEMLFFNYQFNFTRNFVKLSIYYFMLQQQKLIRHTGTVKVNNIMAMY